MATTLVTGATGLVGSHVARALVDARRRRPRDACARPRGSTTSTDLDVEHGRGRRHRPAGGAAGAARRHARVPRRRPDERCATSADDALPRSTCRARGRCSRSACGRASSASSTPPRSPPSARRRRGATADERQVWRGGELGIPYVDSKHEAEVEALRIAARGLPVVIVCPGLRARRRRPATAPRPSSCGASCCAASPPTSTAAINIVDVADVARRAPARRRAAACPASATSSATATTPGPPVRRPRRGSRASRRRRSSCPSPPRSRSPRRSAALPGPTPVTPVEIRSAAHWWTYRSTKAQARAGLEPAPARGDGRGDGRLVPRARGRPARSARARRQPIGWRVAGYARAAGSGELVP